MSIVVPAAGRTAGRRVVAVINNKNPKGDPFLCGKSNPHPSPATMVVVLGRVCLLIQMKRTAFSDRCPLESLSQVNANAITSKNTGCDNA
jgi:hypothetical protein